MVNLEPGRVKSKRKRSNLITQNEAGLSIILAFVKKEGIFEFIGCGEVFKIFFMPVLGMEGIHKNYYSYAVIHPGIHNPLQHYL